MQNKHDPAKQLKKAGTTGQESTVFILLEENEQSEPIRTLPLNQEVVKRKNQRARGHSTLLLTKKESYCTLNTAASGGASLTFGSPRELLKS